MIPKSIRWRLPLSYAAIALLTTLALGVILLLILRQFYQQQAFQYLTTNAQSIGQVIGPAVEAGSSPTQLQAQLTNFAFLSQTRLQLKAPDGQIVADTGVPQTRQEVLALSVEVEVQQIGNTRALTQTVAFGNSDFTPLLLTEHIEHTISDIPIDNEEPLLTRETVMITTTNPTSIEEFLTDLAMLSENELVSEISTSDTPYGFLVNPALDFAPELTDLPRSNLQVIYPLHNEQGQPVGTLIISDGPAYGTQVLWRVGWGWGIASVVAVLVAVGAGWLSSRRISQPLTTLTAATQKMAQGDLNSRANVTTSDELGSLADSFNEMADQVQRTVATLRRFAGDAAHELHTPLTALRTNLELAARSEAADQQQHLFVKANQQVQRLEILTNQLLDLSRLETAAAPPELQPLDLHSLIGRLAEDYASQAEQAGISFTLTLPDIPLQMRGDVKQLQQVFDNLIENALKFTPTDGSISFGASQDQFSKFIEIWVEDNGVGLLAEDIPHLFNRFHRGRNSAAYPGSGLGLAIVKAIVDHHQGEVWAESLAQGSRFVMRFKGQ